MKKTSKYFYHTMIHPGAIGAAIGVADSMGTYVVAKTLKAIGIEIIDDIEETPGDAIDAILDSPWYANLAGPILEEVVFRVVIQGGIKWVVAKILPNREVHILGSIKLSLSQLVSIVATSVIFGLAHYPDGGPALFIVATLSGAVFGVLKEKTGFVSCCAAHIMTNTLIGIADAAGVTI